MDGYHTVVERKTLDDWISTIIHNFDRFQRELQRAAHAGFFLSVVVEGCPSLIENGEYFGRANKKSIYGLERKIALDNPNVSIFWRPTREAAEEETMKILIRQMKKKFLEFGGSGI